MPKVSVIVPVYGVEKYIERCARSLFEQTLDDIEFIFVDDCTPDRSIEILTSVLEEYPQRKKQTRIVHHNENKGLPIARQTGINAATGEYIAHCDSDDWVDNNLYESLITKAKLGNLDVVCCDCKNTDGTNSYIIKAGEKTTIYNCILDMMYRKMWWSLCNKLIRSTLYTNKIMYPQNAMGEDMCICLQLMQYANSIGYVVNVYYNYYINPRSIVNVCSREQCLAKYQQLTSNLNIVKLCYKDRLHDIGISRGLNYLTFYAQEMLLPAIHVDKEIKKKWRNCVQHLCWPVISNKYVIPKQRIKAFLIWIHMFPI